MFNQRPTSSKYRVHSAPPNGKSRIPKKTLAGCKLPPLVMDEPSDCAGSSTNIKFRVVKPLTPDPQNVRLILEQRVSQALAGPPHKLKMQRSSSEDHQNSRQKSFLQSAAVLSSQEMDLVPVDEEELAMLRSINRSQYSSKARQQSTSPLTSKFSSEDLYKHEYEDRSSDDESESINQLRHRRKTSMIRQKEQEDVEASLDGVRLNSIPKKTSIRNLEDRLTGYRHEKLRSSTKSGDQIIDDQMNGLVYDIDFDCYYNPQTDTFYRLKSQSKSGEGQNMVPREIL